jgi:hypothetical protein
MAQNRSKPKPEEPLGITPKWLHDEQRLKSLCEAVGRYKAARMPIPIIWLQEMEELEPHVRYFPYPELVKHLQRPQIHKVEHLVYAARKENHKKLTPQIAL